MLNRGSPSKTSFSKCFLGFLVLISYSIGATIYIIFLLIYTGITLSGSFNEKSDHYQRGLKPTITGKCDAGWMYLEKTNFCYYYHNFTSKNVLGSSLFTQIRAERNCRTFGGHLVSIHSVEEEAFVKDLIKTNLRPLNLPDYTVDKSGCANFYMTWIGLELTSTIFGQYNLRRWTDGTPDDYYAPNTIEYKGQNVYALCNDVAPAETSIWLVFSEDQQARYICKKAPQVQTRNKAPGKRSQPRPIGRLKPNG